MKIQIISDVHVDINSLPRVSKGINFTETLIAALKKKSCDVFLCVGDIAPETQNLHDLLATIVKEIPAQHYLFVPGNHDIWYTPEVDTSGNAESSKAKYENVLPKVCEEVGFHYLPGNPLKIDKIAFIGSIGWYDYSFRDDRWDISLLNYAAKTFKNRVWNDVNYADWGMPDPDVCNWLLEKLEEDYQKIKDEVDDIFLALHHVPFRKFVIYQNRAEWDFFSAFMGSEIFGKWALNKNISKIFFGHTHSKQEGKIEKIDAYCSPIGYLWEISGKITIKEFLENRITLIEL